MKQVGTPREVRSSSAGVVGLVPTMGFLHEGHLALLHGARRQCDTVVMSVFVNPLQFDQPADLEHYPRNLDRDLRLAADAGVDVAYVPSPEFMYPEPPLTSVRVCEVTDHLEGEHRPGHFDGVAIVVAKLLASLQPDRAYFGRKDHQQLIMIQRMAADLSLPVEIVSAPTVREPDGLALSSRNALLDDRASAVSISEGLFAAARAIDEGERDSDSLCSIVGEHLRLDSVQYVAVASQARAQPIPTVDRPSFLAVAGKSGDVRLIDNLPIDIIDGGYVPDLGVSLDEPSRLARR